MMGTYKKGAINIALSIPIYFMIVISILMNKNALIFKTMICSLIYLVFMIIMYKLYSNKNEIVYNIGQFLALFINFIALYYLYNDGIINNLLNILQK